MQIGIEREDVEKKIAKVLSELKHDRLQIDKLRDKLMYHNIMPGVTQQIINEEINLGELDLIVLCLLNIKLWETVERYPVIDPVRFFTDREIAEANRHQEEAEEKIKYPIVIENVERLTSEDYMTTLTAKQLYEWNNSNLFRYNPQTQRGIKRVQKKNIIIEKPEINEKSVTEISNHLLKGTLFPTTITFNMLANGDDSFRYEAKKKQLIIEEGTELDILDGFPATWE